jgi:hypothetical protein
METEAETKDLLETARWAQLKEYDELRAIADGPIGELQLGPHTVPLYSITYLEIQEIADLVGFNPINSPDKIRHLPLDQLTHVAWMAVRGPCEYVETSANRGPGIVECDRKRYVAKPPPDGWAIEKGEVRRIFPRHELALLEAITLFLLLGRLLEIREMSRDNSGAKAPA